MRILITIIAFLVCAYSITAEENKKLWNFELGMGFSISKGNTEKMGMNSFCYLERITRINEFIFRVNGFYSETEKKKDTNKGDLTLKYDRNFWKKESFFLFIFPSYNEFQDLKYRVQNGIGLKHTFIKADTMNYSISAAFIYELKESLSVSEKDELIRLSIRPKVKQSFSKSGTLFFVLFYQPALEDFKNYRLTSDIIFEFNIIKSLFFEFKINDEYNNIVPEGIERNDLSIINSLKIKY